MKKNPVIPYAMIAALGILAIIILSVVGVNQQQQLAEEGGETPPEEQPAEGNGETPAEGGGGGNVDPAQIFQNNCASCHGGDLSGGLGPPLTGIGDTYSAEEIAEIIATGIEGTSMPPFEGQLSEEQIQALATWLTEQ